MNYQMKMTGLYFPLQKLYDEMVTILQENIPEELTESNFGIDMYLRVLEIISD